MYIIQIGLFIHLIFSQYNLIISKNTNVIHYTTKFVNSRNIINGQGCYVYDLDGKKYLDLEAGVWCLSLGHKHPRIMAAMGEQMNQVCHVGYKYNAHITERAAEKLAGIAGFPSGKCVFLSSGSEAVEYGIQIAKVLRPQKKCISLANQYLSAYGNGANLTNQDWICIPWDSCKEKSVEEWYDELTDFIDFQEVGIFVFDAGNSSGLVKLPPYNLVRALSLKIREFNVLTVVDEVTCGIGRTGKWFGYMNYDIDPDIIAAGKGLGNGYPVSAVIFKDEIAKDSLQADFHYAQSHQNDPLGCRIALEVIQTIEDDALLEKAVILGEYLRDGYKKIKERYSIIEEIKGIGLLNSIKFSDEIQPEQMANLDKQLFNAGFIVGMKPKERTLRTYISLIADKFMIDSYLAALDACLGIW